MDQAIRTEIDYAGASLIAWLMAMGYSAIGMPWYSYALMAAFSLVYGAWRVLHISRKLA